MRYLFFLPIFTSTAYSQETAGDFYKDLCQFETNGTGKSLTLKLKLTIPCRLKEKEGERPNIVKKFTYSLADTSILNAILLIKNLPSNLPQKEMQKLLNEKDLKEMVPEGSKAISARKIKVDRVDGGETVYSLTRESPLTTMCMKTIEYPFYYKEKFVQVTYNAGSTSNEKTNVLFDNYKILFKYLATRTVFLNQYQ